MPDCCCIHSDAYQCALRRARISAEVRGEPYPERIDEDDACECYCHSGDEDGLTPWDIEAGAEPEYD